MHAIAHAPEFAFGYHHRKLSRVLVLSQFVLWIGQGPRLYIDGRIDKAGCDWGARFRYSLGNHVDRSAAHPLNQLLPRQPS